MSTRRSVVEDDTEMERLAAGDVTGAREALRRSQVANAESTAIYQFMKLHPGIAPVQANQHILLREARTYGGGVTVPLLELALLKVSTSLIPTAPPVRQPTAQEIAEEERKHLVSLDRTELQALLAKRTYRKPVDSVSADCAALQIKSDVDRLSAPQLKALLYRPSDGSRRAANHEHINRILQGNQN